VGGSDDRLEGVFILISPGESFAFDSSPIPSNLDSNPPPYPPTAWQIMPKDELWASTEAVGFNQHLLGERGVETKMWEVWPKSISSSTLSDDLSLLPSPTPISPDVSSTIFEEMRVRGYLACSREKGGEECHLKEDPRLSRVLEQLISFHPNPAVRTLLREWQPQIMEELNMLWGEHEATFEKVEEGVEWLLSQPSRRDHKNHETIR